MKRNALLIATLPLLVSACFGGTSCEPTKQQICVDDDEFAEYLQGVMDNMVYVEPGEFIMGINNGIPEEGPPIEVYLDGYYLFNTKHSWLGFEFFDQRSGVERKNKKFAYNPDPEFNQGRYGADFAGALLSWNEAEQFCHWLGSETGLPFELPSEAQWEKAAKAGNDDWIYATDNGQLDFGRNFFSKEDHRKGLYPGHELPSKYFPPNPYGFYEMAFNGGEWMRDGYVDNYHELAERENPVMLPEDFGLEPGPHITRVWRSDWSLAHDLTLNYLQSRKTSNPVTGTFSVRCAINTTKPLPDVKY
ncbi:formylglycine-generating enzyme family protein [Salinibius halmophilus]|uniref:formylglycine-generating enzyme family protein n=1 Tax=Salinibius halmophilus TaxID=1853216 RepID=UPI000E66A4E8|nr:SUMF1/EgtB/PvdO family nonheme iron enzyme [Salinibius halmophilus]